MYCGSVGLLYCMKVEVLYSRMVGTLHCAVAQFLFGGLKSGP